MARVNIYIQDDLKARMDRIGEAANWSEIVRPAILSEVASHEHRKEQNMTSVIERLRASKEKHAQERATFGREFGRRWASDTAEYAELRSVSKIVEGNYDGWAAAELIAAIDPNREMDGEDLCAHLGVEESDVEDDDYMAAFIEGAQDVFTEVENQI